MILHPLKIKTPKKTQYNHTFWTLTLPSNIKKARHEHATVQFTTSSKQSKKEAENWPLKEEGDKSKTFTTPAQISLDSFACGRFWCAWLCATRMGICFEENRVLEALIFHFNSRILSQFLKKLHVWNLCFNRGFLCLRLETMRKHNFYAMYALKPKKQKSQSKNYPKQRKKAFSKQNPLILPLHEFFLGNQFIL